MTDTIDIKLQRLNKEFALCIPRDARKLLGWVAGDRLQSSVDLREKILILRKVELPR